MPFKKVPPLYSVWQGMKRRCYNKSSKQYCDYGGRGITVCDGWISDYKAFEADMSPRPTGHTLDRIDNDGGYSPENCRWANKTTQQRNRRDTVKVVIDGTEYVAAELSHKHGIKADTIVARARKGFSISEVISHSRLPFVLTEEHKAKIKKGQQASLANRAHCKHGHEFTSDNTHINRHGHRICRQCGKEKSRRQRAA